MRTPIAEKLAELREKVGRIPAFKTPRKGFTKAQRKAVYDLFGGLCACGCEEPLAGERWDIDHCVPLANGGEHRLSNFQPLLHDHHVRKTAADRKSIAKANRIEKRETEGPKPSRFQNRPFPKDLRKKMNGQVVRREMKA